MSKQGLAWISADQPSADSPVSDYLSSCLLPVLSAQVATTPFSLSSLSNIAEAKRILQAYAPLYHLEAGAAWQQTLALAQKMPGIIYLHDLYHLDENLQLQTLPAEVIASNVVVLSNPRYVGEFAKAHPNAQAYCLALPAISWMQQKESEVLTICSMASLNAEDAMHRLLQSLQKLEQPFVLRWLIDESELELVEALLAQYAIAARLYIGRTVARWQELCAASSYAVFLTSSAIRSCEPYPLISIAASCSAVLSSRIYRDCYPSNAAVFVSLGLGLEYELSSLFVKYPQGCVDQSATQSFIKEQRSVQFVAQELASIFSEVVCKEGSYVSAI